MGNSLVHNIEDAAKTSFIDKDFASDPNFRPQFLSNNYKEGKKILSTLQEELSKCDEFYISVAFITKGGVTPLLQVLKELEDRGVKGKIPEFVTSPFKKLRFLLRCNES